LTPRVERVHTDVEFSHETLNRLAVEQALNDLSTELRGILLGHVHLLATHGHTARKSGPLFGN
jgi:hypothetical protein